MSAQKSVADERLEAATELFSLMTKDFMDQLMSQVMAKSWTQVEEKLQGNIDRATMAEMREETTRIVEAFFNDVTKEYPALYARYFTAREMKELVAFYQTPTGQKALRETPKLMGEAMGIIARKLPTMENQINVAMTEILRRRGLQ
jgi:hypothetical protein